MCSCNHAHSPELRGEPTPTHADVAFRLRVIADLVTANKLNGCTVSTDDEPLMVMVAARDFDAWHKAIGGGVVEPAKHFPQHGLSGRCVHGSHAGVPIRLVAFVAEEASA